MVAGVRTRPSASTLLEPGGGIGLLHLGIEQRASQKRSGLVRHGLPRQRESLAAKAAVRAHGRRRVGQRRGHGRSGGEVLDPAEREQRARSHRGVGMEAGAGGEDVAAGVPGELEPGDASTFHGGEIGGWWLARGGRASDHEADEEHPPATNRHVARTFARTGTEVFLDFSERAPAGP